MSKPRRERTLEEIALIYAASWVVGVLLLVALVSIFCERRP